MIKEMTIEDAVALQTEIAERNTSNQFRPTQDIANEVAYTWAQRGYAYSDCTDVANAAVEELALTYSQ